MMNNPYKLDQDIGEALNSSLNFRWSNASKDTLAETGKVKFECFPKGGWASSSLNRYLVTVQKLPTGFYDVKIEVSYSLERPPPAPMMIKNKTDLEVLKVAKNIDETLKVYAESTRR